MLITRPQPRATMRGPIAFAQSHGPFRLVSMTASQSASVRSWIGPRMLMPALLIRMSILPRRPRRRRRASRRRPPSSRPLRTRPPDGRCPWLICATASSQACRVRPEMAMSAPASASAVAIVRPRPRAPPVTRATRPSRRNESRMLRGFPVGSVNAVLRGRRSRRGRHVPVAAPRRSGLVPRILIDMPASIASAERRSAPPCLRLLRRDQPRHHPRRRFRQPAARQLQRHVEIAVRSDDHVVHAAELVEDDFLVRSPCRRESPGAAAAGPPRAADEQVVLPGGIACPRVEDDAARRDRRRVVARSAAPCRPRRAS